MTTTLLYRALMILTTVAFVSIGQALFKFVSLSMTAGSPLLSWRVAGVALSAFFISGCGSLIYMVLLKSMSLSAAYPFMALSFITVPLLGWWFYGDTVNTPYFLGMALIVAGIVIVTRSA